MIILDFPLPQHNNPELIAQLTALQEIAMPFAFYTRAAHSHIWRLQPRRHLTRYIINFRGGETAPLWPASTPTLSFMEGWGVGVTKSRAQFPSDVSIEPSTPRQGAVPAPV